MGSSLVSFAGGGYVCVGSENYDVQIFRVTSFSLLKGIKVMGKEKVMRGRVAGKKVGGLLDQRKNAPENGKKSPIRKRKADSKPSDKSAKKVKMESDNGDVMKNSGTSTKALREKKTKSEEKPPAGVRGKKRGKNAR